MPIRPKQDHNKQPDIRVRQITTPVYIRTATIRGRQPPHRIYEAIDKRRNIPAIDNVVIPRVAEARVAHNARVSRAITPRPQKLSTGEHARKRIGQNAGLADATRPRPAGPRRTRRTGQKDLVRRAALEFQDLRTHVLIRATRPRPAAGIHAQSVRPRPNTSRARTRRFRL